MSYITVIDFIVNDDNVITHGSKSVDAWDKGKLEIEYPGWSYQSPPSGPAQTFERGLAPIPQPQPMPSIGGLWDGPKAQCSILPPQEAPYWRAAMSIADYELICWLTLCTPYAMGGYWAFMTHPIRH